VTRPTDKQREKFANFLNKKIASFDNLIAEMLNTLHKSELEITEKTTTKNHQYEAFLTGVRRYSSDFNLEWDLGIETELVEDQVPRDSRIRRFVLDEANVQRGVVNENQRLLREARDGLRSLSRELDALKSLEKARQGTLQLLQRRRIQNQIANQKAKIADQRAVIVQIEGITNPRQERINEIQNCLDKLDDLRIGATREAINQGKKNLAKLRAERDETEKMRHGGNFDTACAKWVEVERTKRKKAKIERLRASEEAERIRRAEQIRANRERKRRAADRQKKKELGAKQNRARSASLKSLYRKSEKFLEDNPEGPALKRLEAAERSLRNLELQYSRAEDACVRKVEQLRLGSQRNLVPKNKFRDELVVELRKRNWRQIPSLDELVARLREKSEDVATAKAEAKRAQRVVERIHRAKDQVNEYRNSAHLLDTKASPSKGMPPRIPVENWKDAEELAVRYVKWLGFTDARRTKAGSDEGKDVESKRCVAQVKDHRTGATRPMLQQLFGVASAEKKIPIFFSRSYAKPAIEWGEIHGLALFKFDLHGSVTPVSDAARKLVAK